MKKTLFLLISISFLSFNAHKYYIALTEITYKNDTKAVQMIMNVFIDDIEKTINEEYQVNLQLTTKNELKNTDEYFYKYLKEHFKINVNNTPINYNFVGKEYDGDIVYFYLEATNVSNPTSISVQNTVLLKHFPEQQNLIKATINKERKSLFLDKKNDKGLLKF